MLVLFFEAILVYLMLVWAAIINTLWLNPRVLELVEQHPESGWVVGGTAPLVFGCLVLIPWMATFISKVLNIWSLLILIGIVQFEFKIGFGGAVTCGVLGWLVSLLFTNTIGGPVVKLRNKVFQRVSGSKLDKTNEDILLRFAGAKFEELDTTLAEEPVAEQGASG